MQLLKAFDAMRQIILHGSSEPICSMYNPLLLRQARYETVPDLSEGTGPEAEGMIVCTKASLSVSMHKRQHLCAGSSICS